MRHTRVLAWTGSAVALLSLTTGAETAGGEEGRTFTVAGLEFTAPEGWEKLKPASPMRKAEFKAPGKEGEEAGEVAFFFFGEGKGGSVEANVERWYGQFEEPKDQIEAKSETRERNGKKVTLVRARGTFLSGPPIGAKTPKPGYALLGAILEGEDGPVFVKFTGPAGVVEKGEKDFLAMVLELPHDET
ncbi:MAG TPA: hypothetical protein VMN36_18115 [Verrucomicrobiales bacterium]|nr:hypothetical protein [Verrucomicrobiales bacterium]